MNLSCGPSCPSTIKNCKWQVITVKEMWRFTKPSGHCPLLELHTGVAARPCRLHWHGSWGLCWLVPSRTGRCITDQNSVWLSSLQTTSSWEKENKVFPKWFVFFLSDTKVLLLIFKGIWDLLWQNNLSDSQRKRLEAVGASATWFYCQFHKLCWMQRTRESCK